MKKRHAKTKNRQEGTPLSFPCRFFAYLFSCTTRVLCVGMTVCYLE